MRATDRTSDYAYDLPDELIAQYPAERRDHSRLLVLHRASGAIEHRQFPDVLDFLGAGDVLVVNESRVFPARLRARRPGGGSAEVLLLRPEPSSGDGVWRALVRPGAKLKSGRTLTVADALEVEILDVLPGGERLVRLRSSLPVFEALEKHGEIPLPPYVRREAGDSDRERYQTVYARERGSVAAPTAGLHFTPELLVAAESRGARIARLVLHVGIGTFRPVEVEDPAEHRMHAEWYRVTSDAAATVNEARAAGGSVWAVGTTSVRTLETAADEHGIVRAGEGWTDIFVRPPYRFRAVDRLITNFHLPRSTLLMLVAALAGRDATLTAYGEAVAQRYRFFSYGDAMAVI